MKLVMTYTIGDDCTYSCEQIKLFEYASEEALLCDFMDAVRAADKAYSNWRDLVNPLEEQWRSEIKVTGGKKVNPETFIALQAVRAKDPGQKFKFCGAEWEFSAFYYWDSDNEAFIECPPTVENMDSYFEREGYWKGKGMK